MGLGKVGAEHVQTREQPASAGTLLVVDALLGRFHAEIGIHLPQVLVVLGKGPSILFEAMALANAL
jgi:hypothetical protein